MKSTAMATDHHLDNRKQASDTFPVFNTVCFTFFFSVVSYLFYTFRQKIQTATPLHLTLWEMAALVCFVASFIYFLGFFGLNFLHYSIPFPEDDEEEEEEEHKELEIDAINNIKEIAHSNTVNHGLAEYTSVLGIDDCNKITEDDEAVIQEVVAGKTPSYALESKLGDCKRATFIRRKALERTTGKSLEGLPLDGFNYESILGQCCEMPVGYVQIPVGIAGPLMLDGMEFCVPMATTEGCLVASTNRGCKAINASGGAFSVLLKDGMTRAPVVRFASVKRAAELKFFLEEPLHFHTLASMFNRSSRFGKLQSIRCAIAGKNLYIRFTCSTGDAMGMNMVSKGVQNVLDYLKVDFPDMDIIGISGNYCSDKKPAAINWIEGRGKSVVCEAIIKEEVVKKVLKTDVASLVELNMLKNLTGSAMAGALGGFNAHASNIVSAVFLATGQDPAQNVESSHCITMMEAVNGGKDLHVSVTMPSIEVGTVGGGTQLASQSACLNLLGVKGANRESPGSNAKQLAKVVAGSVLAGELSLMSAIAAGQLVKSHMKYNRSNKDFSLKA
uniref:3-hydroxy-3-methylglutaryl-coenzyme A reductase 3-like n=1 Tax=Erigeron canadensis TaxID=72917 RepID=UPI001CB99A98|nr:3-hydroxy-3-methylglutaryl-coenzyme A reductase 3-like [Erigeron canadensis]